MCVCVCFVFFHESFRFLFVLFCIVSRIKFNHFIFFFSRLNWLNFFSSFSFFFFDNLFMQTCRHTHTDTQTDINTRFSRVFFFNMIFFLFFWTVLFFLLFCLPWSCICFFFYFISLNSVASLALIIHIKFLDSFFFFGWIQILYSCYEENSINFFFLKTNIHEKKEEIVNSFRLVENSTIFNRIFVYGKNERMNEKYASYADNDNNVDKKKNRIY